MNTTSITTKQPKKASSLWLFFYNIFQIARKDFSSLRYNFTAWATIIGLGIIPSLYAWFYLASAWDPYGSTKGIKFAVSSQDQGFLLSGKWLNIGDSVIENLKKNDNIGRQFVDQSVAYEGVERGSYSAAIIIDKHFTQDILSFASDHPQQGNIEYIVNQKTNAIASKISFQGMSTIKASIQENFIHTLNKTVFENINSLGITLKEQEPLLHANLSLLNNINTTVQSLNNQDTTTLQQLDTLEELITLTQNNLPALHTILGNNQEQIQKIDTMSQSQRDYFIQQLQDIDQALSSAQSITQNLQSLTTSVQQGSQGGYQTLQQDIDTISGALAKLITTDQTILARLNTVNDFFGNLIGIRPLQYSLSILENTILTLQSHKKNIALLDQKSESFHKDAQSLTSNISKLLRTQQTSFNRLDNHITSNLIPFVKDSGSSSLNSLSSILDTVDKKVPLIDTTLSLSQAKIKNLQSNINTIHQQLPKIQKNINTITQHINSFQNNKLGSISEQLLAFNPDRQADIASNIVAIHEKDLFNIPNYGSGMAPFFTVLALWTGALLLVNIFSTGLSYPNTYTSQEKIIGKLILFLSITGGQALILSLGNIFILGAYTSYPILFVISSILIAWTWATITFSLVKIFGNVGKVLAIILLVLQLTGAGGSFPVELSPPFFQAIHPYLPFTYAIGALRETVGGVVRDNYFANITVLLGFGLLFLIAALQLSPHTAKFVKKMDENLLKTGLTPH